MPANIKLYDRTTDPEDHLSRFSSAANSREWPMPVWCSMFQQTLDGSARGWFENLSQGSIDGWAELRQQFTTRFSTRRACFKDPTEITKIVRKANETLATFKERWIVETGFITGVPEVMKISSFMDAHKCPELAKRYSDKLSKGEMTEGSRRPAGSVSRRDDRFHKGGYGADRRRNEGRNTFNPRDGTTVELAATKADVAPSQEGKSRQVLRLSWRKRTLTQRLLSKQLRSSRKALESEKLNHLIKDVRQRGRENVRGRDVGRDKVVNMIRSWPNDRKRKSVERDKS
ncbi:reverse transcriptase domain-containing protein [Tanacetum coccineum]